MEKISKDITAALVDNEISDESVRNQIISRMEIDADLKYDYMVQALVKNLIREKVRYAETPVKVRQKVIKKIKPKELRSEKSFGLFSEILNRPALSFATVIVIVLAVILILLNRPGVIEQKDFAIEQFGEDNMFIQARNNFTSILEGKLAPQLTSSNPDEIKAFFQSSGVNYSTLVPDMPKWELLGAVVSEDRGEKFAHHVYANDEGELVYLFQVDESYLYTHEIIKLTDDLLNYLDHGNCYVSETDNYVTLMSKAKNNIYAVVSNASINDISKNFCSLN